MSWNMYIYIYIKQTYFAGYTKFHARFKSLNQSVQCKRKPMKSKESKWLDPQNGRKLHFANTVILCGLFGALWICYLPKPSASKLAQLCGEGEQLQQVLQVQLRGNWPRGWLSGFCQFCFWWCFVDQNSHLWRTQGAGNQESLPLPCLFTRAFRWGLWMKHIKKIRDWPKIELKTKETQSLSLRVILVSEINTCEAKWSKSMLLLLQCL